VIKYIIAYMKGIFTKPQVWGLRSVVGVTICWFRFVRKVYSLGLLKKVFSKAKVIDHYHIVNIFLYVTAVIHHTGTVILCLVLDDVHS
jgi:hypothetical protein